MLNPPLKPAIHPIHPPLDTAGTKAYNPCHSCHPPMDTRGGWLRELIHLQRDPLAPDYDDANALSLTEHLGQLSSERSQVSQPQLPAFGFSPQSA